MELRIAVYFISLKIIFSYLISVLKDPAIYIETTHLQDPHGGCSRQEKLEKKSADHIALVAGLYNLIN